MKNTVDFMKIVDANGKLLGALNINNMVPVDDSVLRDLNITVTPDDDSSSRAYKSLLAKQLAWCNDNRDVIVRRASKLYRIVTEQPDSARSLVRRCCNFAKLEQVLAKRQSRYT